MKKSEIQIRYERGREYPTFSVKHYPWIQPGRVALKLGCTEEQAERAIRFYTESAQSQFWEQAQESADFIFKLDTVKIYSAGRSGGNLIASGLPPLESWDAIRVSQWSRFEKSILADIAYRANLDTVCNDIAANNWHLEGAELCNFVDTQDGRTICIAEMKAEAVAAGFAQVVRS